MTLRELLKILSEINNLLVKLETVDIEKVPVRIYGDHGIPRRIEFDALGMTMSQDIK